MQRTVFKGDPVWIEALEGAIGPGSAPDGVVVFVEDRQDVVVTLDSRGDGPWVEHSRTRGVAVQQAGGGLRFRADPRPGDLAPLLAGDPLPARVPAAGSGRRRPDPCAGPPVDDAVRTLGMLLHATSKLQAGPSFRARWVGFDQYVHLARPGRPATADLRRGRRIQLRADISRGSRTARATGDLVLRSDRTDELIPALARLAGEVAARAEARLGADTLPSGKRPIVFAPGVGGVLIHEIVGHALEADTLHARASWLAEPFAGSPLVRVLDDPRRGRASWHVDDEGTPARAVPLVREGRVVGRLHDRATARLDGAEPTGHGRRASFREPVRPRMGCTFLAPGRCAPEEAVAGLERGIYVRRMEAAHTDPRSGRAVFRVTDADRIQNGRLVSPLAPHLIRVEGRVALGEVACVAEDLAFDVCVGSCLHHGQPLAVSVGSPTFRIGPTSVQF